MLTEKKGGTMLLAVFFETVLSAKRIHNLDAHNHTAFFTESVTLETATWQRICFYFLV